MNREELKTRIEKICTDMLTHDRFIHAAECLYCEKMPNASGYLLSDEEIESWYRLNDDIYTVRVNDLITYLKDNFKLDDKLCYMDCVEGYKNDCTYVMKDQLGTSFFYYVKDLQSQDHPHVDLNDVVVI